MHSSGMSPPPPAPLQPLQWDTEPALQALQATLTPAQAMLNIVNVMQCHDFAHKQGNEQETPGWNSSDNTLTVVGL